MKIGTNRKNYVFHVAYLSLKKRRIERCYIVLWISSVIAIKTPWSGQRKLTYRFTLLTRNITSQDHFWTITFNSRPYALMLSPTLDANVQQKLCGHIHNISSTWKWFTHSILDGILIAYFGFLSLYILMDSKMHRLCYFLVWRSFLEERGLIAYINCVAFHLGINSLLQQSDFGEIPSKL